MESNKYTCPVCKSKNLFLKHEASYIYSYVLDSDAPGLKNSLIFSPFLYDKREQTSSKDYIECEKCNTRLPIDLLYKTLDKNFSNKTENKADYII
ncbi:hypothetical protein [Herbinix luporum]|jgi:DNA-directed RNA polymerase subunit RPC12/RpoP|uniref:Uncharacterized protein n=1 Tax=Herbinix luporum TaxID=1679721 RepID=A0A0K8J8E9_9FIRM|nr:hypothetical protein [Herbinix luporum]MDI9488251.1 hypothetical protein [Bacillota bacterium]CUH93860.1 hypothetical protein SD1D_2348 [Herbinix luporum]HHT57635.1 hypothetical protein [Herbinix luporum]